MELIHQAVELVKEVLTLLLKIFNLLEFYFEFPLGFLVATFDRFYFGRYDIQLCLDLQVDQLLLLEFILLSLGLV